MSGKGLEIFWMRSWRCLVTSSGRENVAEGSHQLFVKYCNTRVQLEIQSKLNSCKYYLASWATKLTLGFTEIKMKTYNWNSSVALLSPTCSSKFPVSFRISCEQSSLVHGENTSLDRGTYRGGRWCPLNFKDGI